MSSGLYILDTNTVSYLIKGRSAALRGRVQATPLNQLAISVITEAELRYWAFNRPHEARIPIYLGDFFRRVPSRPLDSSVAESYARLRSACKQNGTPLAELDMLIAAHAVALDATLVTHDKAFQRIDGLNTEDWV